jgi:hypothetical protein
MNAGQIVGRVFVAMGMLAGVGVVSPRQTPV